MEMVRRVGYRGRGGTLAMVQLILSECTYYSPSHTTPSHATPSHTTPQYASLEFIELIDISKFKEDSKPMEPRTIHLKITGMSCSSCVAKIERHMEKKRGKVTPGYHGNDGEGQVRDRVWCNG